jgi:hypothetical protein
MVKRCIAAAAWCALVLGGCGDKVPQSEAAKRIGEVPKQTIDKAAADTATALRQSADRNRDPE